MRVTIERTGGFAGMKMTKTIDTASLSAEAKNQLCRLIDAADFFRLPLTITSKTSQPDRFQYRVTVEESSQEHQIVVSEQAVPPTLRPLIEWLMIAARRG